jgi:hypothetical protein
LPPFNNFRTALLLTRVSANSAYREVVEIKQLANPDLLSGRIPQ